MFVLLFRYKLVEKMFVTGSVMNSTTVSYLTSRGKVYVKTATYSDRLVYKINISKSTTYIVSLFLATSPLLSAPTLTD